MIPVLLVDDQPSNLEALELMLASSGCRVVQAQSADQALLALLEEDFAAIILDIRMPGMDGFELARLIRQRKRTFHVPILFLTAYMLDEADALRGYEAGAVDYLIKPINPIALRSKIAVFVELFRQRRALAKLNESLGREIVDRERAQDGLRLANQELEVRVLERTDALNRAHQVVLENEERLRLALDAARMSSWVWDVDHDVVTWSPSPAEIVAGATGDFTGSLADLLALVHPDDRPMVDQTLHECLRNAGDYRCELRFLQPNGSSRWAIVAGKVVVDQAGLPSRMTGVDLDITDRKRAEEALRQADRRKDEFLAMLAHELRNPLAPVSYAVQILNRKSPLTPELSWARGVIERQLQLMTRLIDDLIDVSRISRGTLELRRRISTLEPILRDALETARPLIESRGIRLSISAPGEPVSLDGDPVRLAQAFNNLLNNAAKYTDRGGEITLAAAVEQGQLQVTVSDTGIGIPADMLEHVFEIFTQLDRSLERAQGGLGVGLTLCRKIVEMHGGHIEAHSDGPGRGSRFAVRLPVVPTDETSPGRPSGQHGERISNRHRILIAEDGRDAAESFGILLRTMGHEVQVVYDGQEALDAAGLFRPGVVIMDLGMPKLNGFDAARRIREEPWGKEVFLIALTGWGQREDRLRSQQAGFDLHFTKPVDPMALESLLASLNGTVKISE